MTSRHCIGCGVRCARTWKARMGRYFLCGECDRKGCALERLGRDIYLTHGQNWRIRAALQARNHAFARAEARSQPMAKKAKKES